MTVAVLKVYRYKNCGTCWKALKRLDVHGLAYSEIPIRERPPTKTELRRMLGYLDRDIKKLFNTSGRDYEALNLKEKLPTMSRAEALVLLG